VVHTQCRNRARRPRGEHKSRESLFLPCSSDVPLHANIAESVGCELPLLINACFTDGTLQIRIASPNHQKSNHTTF
jgi:hypothetical protein